MKSVLKFFIFRITDWIHWFWENINNFVAIGIDRLSVAIQAANLMEIRTISFVNNSPPEMKSKISAQLVLTYGFLHYHTIPLLSWLDKRRSISRNSENEPQEYQNILSGSHRLKSLFRSEPLKKESSMAKLFVNIDIFSLIVCFSLSLCCCFSLRRWNESETKENLIKSKITQI